MVGKVLFLAPIYLAFFLTFPKDVKSGGECEFESPELLQFVGHVKECLDEYPKNLLCWLQCFMQKIEVVSKSGVVDLGKMDELLAAMPDGNLKSVLTTAKGKCLVGIEKFDVTLDKCAGFRTVGICMTVLLQKECSNFVTFVKEYAAQVKSA